MQQQISNRDQLVKSIVIMMDMVLLNFMRFALVWIGYLRYGNDVTLFWNVGYIIAIFAFLPIAQNRLVKYEQIVSRAFTTSILMSSIFFAQVAMVYHSFMHVKLYLIYLLTCFVCIIISRTISRIVLRYMRSHGRNSRTVVFVGAGVNLKAVYEKMVGDISTGYKIVGYFDDNVSKSIGDILPLLGEVKDVVPYLEKNRPDMLFCNLQSQRYAEILEVMNYCENNLIHFYSVPNVRNYVHRAMNVEFVDDIPVLSLRNEPLTLLSNRILKRTFDIVFSLLFLVLVFWWVLIIVSIITWITMPGPVFFRQKRNGFMGKEFTCLKFRSMKVNDDADKVQATKNDPRKTKWGNIMRKTNIDELPQFLNVLMGDMSVVGPRPHMVKHTEEYSALINKYMVRHFAKPGITGWAQVTGARGETEELWQMEDRIKKDIFYVENWSVWLDIHIIIKTVTNMLGGEKGNAY